MSRPMADLTGGRCFDQGRRADQSPKTRRHRNYPTQRISLDGQIGSAINDITRWRVKIADLNAQIKLTEVGGQQANDLRDQRGRF